MQFIQGQQHNQTYFTTLEDQVSIDNPVRLIDVVSVLEALPVFNRNLVIENFIAKT